MKRRSDYHVTIQHRVDPIWWTRAWRWRNGKFDCFKLTRQSSYSRYVSLPLLWRFIKPAPRGWVSMLKRNLIHLHYLCFWKTHDTLLKSRFDFLLCRCFVNICISYTSRDEICSATREIAEGVQMGLIRETCVQFVCQVWDDIRTDTMYNTITLNSSCE